MNIRDWQVYKSTANACRDGLSQLGRDRFSSPSLLLGGTPTDTESFGLGADGCAGRRAGDVGIVGFLVGVGFRNMGVVAVTPGAMMAAIGSTVVVMFGTLDAMAGAIQGMLHRPSFPGAVVAVPFEATLHSVDLSLVLAQPLGLSA